MKEFLECHRLCLEVMTHCLGVGGMYSNASHIQRLLDCASLSQLTAELLARASPLAPRASELCMAACAALAAACEPIHPDPRIQECTAAAARCAASCRRLAAERL